MTRWPAVAAAITTRMFPENPFLQLTLPRANRALGRLQRMIWKEIAAYPASLSEETRDNRPIREIKVSPYELISLRIR